MDKFVTKVSLQECVIVLSCQETFVTNLFTGYCTLALTILIEFIYIHDYMGPGYVGAACCTILRSGGP